MIQSNTTFLGKTQIVKSVEGCKIELTGYTNDIAFEQWHSHTNASISFLLSGSHREDLFGKEHVRVPGDIKFIPSGELHRCKNYVPGTRKINLDIPAGLLRQMDVSEDDVFSLLSRNGKPKFTLIKLYHELNDVGSHAAASAHLMLYELFHPAENEKKASGQIPLWVCILKDILHDEWDKTFDLHDLSSRLGVHPVTISRYFPLYFSSTLGNYLWFLKIEKALSLIKGTDRSLTDIAYICGFADQAHFTRTFKKITGFSPKEFRKA
jgi:AraC family transcriptional regulator